MKATLARLKKQIGDYLPGEKGMTLSIERIRYELRESKAVTPPDARLSRTVSSLQRSFAEILLNRVDRDLHGIPVNEILVKVSMVAHAHVHAGFDFLRRYLPFPDESTLHRHYPSVIEEEQMNFSDSRGIDSILARHEGMKYVTIAVDTVSLDSVFSVIGKIGLDHRSQLRRSPITAYLSRP